MSRCALLVMCFAIIGVSNAASVTWSSGSFTQGFLAPDESKITSSMGYSIEVMFYSDAAGKIALNETPSTANLDTFYGGFSGETTADYFNFVKDTTYYVQAIVQNDTSIRSTDVLPFAMPSTGDAGLNFSMGVGFAEKTNKWGDWTEKGGEAPEPTTCSLLLVGLAGMGLKRLRSRRRQQA